MAKIREMLGEKLISGFRGKLDFYYHNGVPCVRRWPKSPGSRRAPAVQTGWTPFREAVQAWNTLPLVAKQAYKAMASGSGLTPRDLHMRGYMSGLPKLYDHPGSPPLPPNPSHWSLTAIRRHTSPTLDLICAQTNVPCHLWLRKTSRKVWYHKTPILRRGIQMHCDIRICFTSYVGIEQRELGDTYIHSFLAPPPKPAKLFLFYLYGTINFFLSPSVSPILAAHYKLPITTPTIIEEWSS